MAGRAAESYDGRGVLLCGLCRCSAAWELVDEREDQRFGHDAPAPAIGSGCFVWCRQQVRAGGGSDRIVAHWVAEPFRRAIDVNCSFRAFFYATELPSVVIVPGRQQRTSTPIP